MKKVGSIILVMTFLMAAGHYGLVKLNAWAQESMQAEANTCCNMEVCSIETNNNGQKLPLNGGDESCSAYGLCCCFALYFEEPSPIMSNKNSLEEHKIFAFKGTLINQFIHDIFRPPKA